MRVGHLNFLPPFLAALGLAFFAAVFAGEMESFRKAVVDWASRDLATRTELAAANLREPLGTGNFRVIYEFGESCREQGLRLTIFSRPGGGLIYDSIQPSEAQPECLYETRAVGNCSVRLGLPEDRVLAPFRRARLGFLFAGLTGGACVLLVILFTYRQHVRIRELARLEQFRREFIADVSHELKTPLTGILGAVDLLKDEPPPPVRARLLSMVRKESERLNVLAQDVLSLARIEREGFTLNRTETDVEELIRETVEHLQPRANAAHMSLRVKVEQGIVLSCDAQLLSRAISNLIENAIRYSQSPDVLVSAWRTASAVMISVEDHGIGIPAEHAPRVFERFYRVDSARSAETGGSGLGLAIVRGISRLHGGDVSLAASEPTGCRFTIRIPSATSAAPHRGK